MFKWLKNAFTGKKDEEIEVEDKDLEAGLEEESEEAETEVDEIKTEGLEVEEQEEEVEEGSIDEDLAGLSEEVEEKEESLEEVEVKERGLDQEEKEDEKIEEEKISEEASEEVSEEVDEEPLYVEEVEIEVEEEIKEKEEVKEKLGFFAKLKQGLEKTRDNFTGQINNILKSYHKIDEDLFEDLEEILITSDVGIETTMDIIDNLRDRVQEERVTEPEDVMGLLKDEIKKSMNLSVSENGLNIDPSPAVVLVVGVNGVGKTTTIGKMANQFKQDGKKVLIAAGDTFRAAAIEQLEEWGNRAGVDIVSHSEGSDPAAVIYDGIQAAKARNVDVLICDTAGRLHNKSNLMNELNKIFRVVENEFGNASKEVLLVLDATTGQNALSQAKVFKEVANITGIALTKLDGTAKGGVVIALQSEMGIPIKLVGVGEGIDDLQPFNTDDFVEAMFEK